jgi:AcrR family transcriptional regulator
MNRREVSKNETRQLILDAAKKLFLKTGVDQCTMRRIAKEAGVSPASVVVHFKNKTALLEVALYEDIDHNIRQAIASMPTDKDLVTRLMHLSHAMFTFYDTNRKLYCALIRNTVFEPVGENPHLTRQLDEFLQLIAGIIKQDKILGYISKGVDSWIVARSFFALYFWALSDFLRNPETTVEMATEGLSSMARQLLAGIQLERHNNDNRSQ